MSKLSLTMAGVNLDETINSEWIPWGPFLVNKPIGNNKRQSINRKHVLRHRKHIISACRHGSIKTSVCKHVMIDP